MIKEKGKRCRFAVLAIVVFAVLCAAALYKMDSIYGVLSAAKEQIIDGREYAYRNKTVDVDLSEYTSISYDNDAWYNTYSIISHAGGGIDGKLYTDCMEAWEQSYANGNRVVDADLSFTSDLILVLRHEWYDDLEQDNISEDNIPTYDEFMNTPIHYKYTPMSCYDMLAFMEEHDDLYVACDFKDDGTKTFSFLVEAAEEIGCTDALDRIIVSFYSYSDYDAISQVYPFKNWAIRQYENEPHNYYELAAFCMDTDIPVCMVKKKYLDAGDDISVLTSCGITVFAAVVNEIDELGSYMDIGVSGCVSDYLYESDLQYIK